VIHAVFGVYELGLIAYVVLSWIKVPGAQKPYSVLHRFYDPPLMVVRKAMQRVVPQGALQVDLSPLVLILAVYLLRGLVIHLLVPGF